MEEESSVQNSFAGIESAGSSGKESLKGAKTNQCNLQRDLTTTACSQEDKQFFCGTRTLTQLSRPSTGGSERTQLSTTSRDPSLQLDMDKCPDSSWSTSEDDETGDTIANIVTSVLDEVFRTGLKRDSATTQSTIVHQVVSYGIPPASNQNTSDLSGSEQLSIVTPFPAISVSWEEDEKDISLPASPMTPEQQPSELPPLKPQERLSGEIASSQTTNKTFTHQRKSAVVQKVPGQKRSWRAELRKMARQHLQCIIPDPLRFHFIQTAQTRRYGKSKFAML